ncbi:MAG: hypothetical protein ACREMY_30010 [bacterium]
MCFENVPDDGTKVLATAHVYRELDGTILRNDQMNFRQLVV